MLVALALAAVLTAASYPCPCRSPYTLSHPSLPLRPSFSPMRLGRGLPQVQVWCRQRGEAREQSDEGGLSQRVDGSCSWVFLGV